MSDVPAAPDTGELAAVAAYGMAAPVLSAATMEVATLFQSHHQAHAQAFASLSESDRELLSLVAWESLSRDEIAVALGTSRAVVRLRLHRARKRLRDALAPTQRRFSGGAEHEWT